MLKDNPPQKTAIVIIIGNEILSGRTQDSNLAYIAKNLVQLGIFLKQAIVIPDEEEVIIEKVRSYSANTDYVFTTGGIGPTHDDITTAAIAKAFNKKLFRHPEIVACMQRYYPPGGVTAARLKMADVPEGATLIANPVSDIPAYQVNNVFVLAGVPQIMQAMFDGLVSKLVGGPPILSASVVTNLSESKLAEGMRKLAEDCREVSVGSYPYFKSGGVGVSIVLRSVDSVALLRQLEAIKALVVELGGELIEIEMPEL